MTPLPVVAAAPSPIQAAGATQGSARAGNTDSAPRNPRDGNFSNTLDEKMKSAAQDAPTPAPAAPPGNGADQAASKGTPTQQDDKDATANGTTDAATQAALASALMSAVAAPAPTPQPGQTSETTDTTAAIAAAINAGDPSAANGGDTPAFAPPGVPAAAQNAGAAAKNAGPDTAQTTTPFSSMLSAATTQNAKTATDEAVIDKAALTQAAVNAAQSTASAEQVLEVKTRLKTHASAESELNTTASNAPTVNAATTPMDWSEHLNRAQAARVDTPQFKVATPASQSGWAEDVGNRIAWMASKSLGKAELVLTPPHLGRIEVSLSVNGDQASAQFVAATPGAREALEQALPRLREVMEQAGVTLGQVNVSANGANSQGGRDNWTPRNGLARDQRETDAVGGVIGTATPTGWGRSTIGLVDTFA